MRAGAVGGFAPARLGTRFAAWLIDSVVCFVPAAIAYLALVYFTFHSQWYFQSASFFEVIEKGTELVFNYPVDYLHVPLITVGVWITAALILCVIGGVSSQTLGRKITGVRLVQAHTGDPLGGGSALMRGAIFNVIAAVPGIGFIVHVLVILSDTSQHQGIHDRAARARIIPANIDPAVARLHAATAQGGGSAPYGSAPYTPAAHGSAPYGSVSYGAATPGSAPYAPVDHAPGYGVTPSGAPHADGRPDSQASAYSTPPAGAPPEAPSWLNPDARQPINSPLARSLNAPPPVSAPPAPLPSWLDRHTPAADPTPADPLPGADRTPTADPASPAPTSPPGSFTQPTGQSPSAPTGQVPLPPAGQSPSALPGQVPPPPAGQAPSQIDDEVEMTRLVQPGRSRRAYRPSAPDPVQGRIRVSDGQVQDIRGTTLVGRNPAPRPGERAVTLLSVQDPERSVSKTHIIIGVDARGLWMADRTSTNGSVVILADGQQIVCLPEQQVRLSPGAKIQIGNVVITVLPL